MIDLDPTVAGRQAFAAYRLGRADIVDLPNVIGQDRAVRAELMPVIALLGRCSPGEFATLADLYLTLPGPPAKPSPQAIERLRDLFLNLVDRRLQQLYRSHLQRRPPPSGASHVEKVASLDALRGEAFAVVQSYDWVWLERWLDLPRIGQSAEDCRRRLSNLAFGIRRVNFRFTYHCNIACRHCYNHSGPDKKAQRLDPDAMLAIIAQMPAVGIDALNLSGGEPFLYPDMLDALIAAGRSAGLHEISLFSNGFWAATESRARKTLTRLADAGFMQGAGDYLKLSSGVYHQEFIAFERMLIAARTYHALFGRRMKLDIELPAGEAAPPDDYARRIAAEGLSDLIEVGFRPVAPVGRAAELESIDVGAPDAPCHDINQIVFDPDGVVRPCCGLNSENQGVVIGALGDQDLRGLVKSMQNDPVLQFISRNPLTTIRKHMEGASDRPPPAAYCAACQDTIGDLRDKAPLQAALFSGQKFYPFWFAQPA